MARATLEMFLKLTGANKTSQGLDKVSKSTKELDKDVKNSAKNNEQFAAGMSGLGATAIVGAAGLAAKSLLDFSLHHNRIHWDPSSWGRHLDQKFPPLYENRNGIQYRRLQLQKD